MGSTIKSLTKAKSQLDTLKTKMNTYSKRIDEMNSSLNNMMKGDGNMAYWTGQNAFNWYTDALKKLTTVINNYKNCFLEFEDYAIMYDKAYAKSKLKLTAAQVKALASKFDGSTFIAGVAKNKEDKKIAAVPSTVSTDAANDDQNQQSYTCYKALINAIEDIALSCTALETTWKAVASNTTGTMSSDAKKRASAMTARKKNATAMADSLEEDYIGDILFSR